ATWYAIRRVIVVVFPDPAPARMQTGPRTASAARRCSGFRPSRTWSALMRSTLEPPRDGPPREDARKRLERVPRVLNRLGALRRVGEPRLAHHRREARDQVQRLARVDEPLELRELLLQPRSVHRPARDAQDLRVARLRDVLVVGPALLSLLLPRANADDLTCAVE